VNLVTTRLRNDLLCVGWGVKLYSLTHLVITDLMVQIKCIIQYNTIQYNTIIYNAHKVE